MNCSMCQEKLDERLDQLRARVQDGTVSRAQARAQGMAALQEVMGECAECEQELRTHLNVRLAFLSAEPEPVTLPPEFRANVRRALERESASSSASWGKRPRMNFVWTGGAMLSAIGLFVIARPFLIQQAQKPPTMSVGSSPTSDVTKAESEKAATLAAPQILPSATPGSARANQGRQRALTPTQKARSESKPSSPPSSESATSSTLAAPEKQQPLRVPAPSKQGVVMPPPAVAPSAPPSPLSSDVVPRGRHKEKENEALPNSRSILPNAPSQSGLRFSTTPTISPQTLAGRTVPDASASLNDSANARKPRLGVPLEPQLDTNALAPTGEELGLKVRIVSAPARRNAIAGGFGGGGFGGNAGTSNFGGGGMRGGGFGGGTVQRRQGELVSPDVESPPATLVVPPAPATQSVSPQRDPALESRGIRNDAGNTSPSGVKVPAPAFAAPGLSRSANGSSNVLAAPMAPKGNAASSSDAARGQSKVAQGLLYDNDLQKGGPSPSVWVSVASPVVNARIKGRVKDKSDEDILLWSGDIAAKQSVAVSLVPLGALKGDEVYISVEQQISLGQTRKLATTSAIVP